MKILHFYKTYFPDSYGGTEQVIFQLASGAASQGHSVDVLALSRDTTPGPLCLGNHTVHHAHLATEIASTGLSIDVFSKFRHLAATADIIHYHFPWPLMDLVHLATRPKVATVVTYHSDIIRQRRLLPLYRPVMRRFLDSVDQIVATSPNYLATSDVLSSYRDKAMVIPIGLDENTYPVPTPLALDRWRSRFPGPFFLFVGALRYYKGLHILLDALAGTEFTAVIVGAGPMDAELRSHASRLNLQNVHFLGLVSDEDRSALLTLCLAVVFPSHLRSEAFGVSLLEGAMFSKPMISSEIGTGTTFVNIHGETGFVVPPSSPADFREAMRRLWLDHQQAAELGRRARQRYETEFTGKLMMERHLDLYTMLEDRSRRRRT